MYFSFQTSILNARDLKPASRALKWHFPFGFPTPYVNIVEVRGIERENVGLWNGYVILYIIQECGVNPLFILCSQTHDIIKLISNKNDQIDCPKIRSRSQA